MNLFLVFSIATIFLVQAVIKKKDLLSPGIIFTAGFLLSSVILYLNSESWNYQISQHTLVVIVFGLVSFCFGSFLADRFGYKKIDQLSRHSKIDCRKHETTIFDLNKTGSFFIIALALLGLFARLADMFMTTGSFNFFGSISSYKELMSSSPLNIILKLFNPIVILASIVSFVIIISNFFVKKRLTIKYLIPIIVYFFYFALCGARIEIIYLSMYFIIIFILLARFYKRTSIKYFLVPLTSILLLVFLFFWLGTLTGKTQMQKNMWDNLSMYTASSLASLDYKLQFFSYSVENLGSSSLRGIANFTSLFGVKISSVGNRNLDFVILGNMTHQTNIYTCFYTLIFEFNYFSTYLILLIEGFVFKYLYNKTIATSGKKRILWIIVYSYVAGYFGLSFVAERVFSSLLTLTSLIFFVLLIVFSNLFLVEKKYR